MSIKKKAPRIHAMQEPKVVVSVALVPSLAG
jgi:hypothetical protein